MLLNDDKYIYKSISKNNIFYRASAITELTDTTKFNLPTWFGLRRDVSMIYCRDADHVLRHFVSEKPLKLFFLPAVENLKTLINEIEKYKQKNISKKLKTNPNEVSALANINANITNCDLYITAIRVSTGYGLTRKAHKESINKWSINSALKTNFKAHTVEYIVDNGKKIKVYYGFNKEHINRASIWPCDYLLATAIEQFTEKQRDSERF